MNLPPANAIQAALDAGRIPVGMQCFSSSAPLVEIIGHAGFDFVMIDTEHACIDSARVEDLCRVADSVDLMPLVRVAENDSTSIRKALEAGAQGLIVPRIQTAADVARAQDAARYPPVGTRGMCPATRASRYSLDGWDDHVRWTNEHLPVIPLLEHPTAIENVEDILGLPDVDIVLFGPGDLGAALGFGSAGMRCPEVERAFDHVLEVAKRTDTLVMGVPFPDLSAAACRSLVERGVRILLHSVDELLFSRLCSEIISELQPALWLSGHAPDAVGVGPH